MSFGKNRLQKAERRFGKYAVRNLMTAIIIGMAAVFILDMFLSVDVGGLLAFDKAEILRGQVWRLVMFIFLPPSTSYLFIIFSLYFYWLLGSTLENEWGSFKFNVFYLCGMLGTVVAGMISGYATNYYINMSLFFAFAILHPNFQILLFFIIPLKIKYLAFIDAALFLYMFIISGWPGRVALLVSLANIALFFGGNLYGRIKQIYHRAKWKSNMRR